MTQESVAWLNKVFLVDTEYAAESEGQTPG